MNKLSWGLMLSHQNVFWYKNLAISLHLIAELAGTIQHGAAPDLFPQRLPLQCPLPKSGCVHPVQVSRSTQARWIGNATSLSTSWYLFAGYQEFSTLLKDLFNVYCSCLKSITHSVRSEAARIYGVTQLCKGSHLLISRNKFRNF